MILLFLLRLETNLFLAVDKKRKKPTKDLSYIDNHIKYDPSTDANDNYNNNNNLYAQSSKKIYRNFCCFCCNYFIIFYNNINTTKKRLNSRKHLI